MKKETYCIEFTSDDGLSKGAKQLIKASLGLALSEVFHLYNLKWKSERKYFTDPEECL